MRFTFLIKVAIGAALVVLFDRLFPDGFSGAAIGGFAAAWIVALVLARPDIRRSRPAWVAIGIAAALAAVLFDDPGTIAWVMFWSALSIAALLPRASRFDDAWQWGARLVLHGLSTASRFLGDARRLIRLRRGERRGVGATAALLALPVLGGGVFVILFAAANPLIEDALVAIRLPMPAQLAVWAFVAACVWPSLRPHPGVIRWTRDLPDPEPRLPGTSLPSVLIALALFNLLFAVQNALDIAFLWSGGPLPAGMSQTEYVHRGAYPLIGTALIAGVMALAMLRPGSDAAADRRARGLVVLWVAQNLILVASSVLRTLDYIETSMLTEWRIAALLWMALVALGLVLIGWRIVSGRTARWLINWNALAAVVVLGVTTVVDLGAVAAAWNVRHQKPADVDLCYLAQVGDGALLPLIAMERQPMDAQTRDALHFVREEIYADLLARQASWTRWTLRGARRLAAASPVLGRPLPQPPLPQDAWRDCNGRIVVMEPAARPRP